MFPDPQSLTLAGSSISLARVKTTSNGAETSSVYQNADESLVLTITHKRTTKGRIRTEIRQDWKKIVTNPLDSTNDYDSTSVYTVIDRPLYGFSITDIDNLVITQKGWMTTTNVTKLYGQES